LLHLLPHVVLLLRCLHLPQDPSNGHPCKNPVTCVIHTNVYFTINSAPAQAGAENKSLNKGTFIRGGHSSEEVCPLSYADISFMKVYPLLFNITLLKYFLAI